MSVIAVAGCFVAAGAGATISAPGARTLMLEQGPTASLCVTNLVAYAGSGAVYGEFTVAGSDVAVGVVVEKPGLDLDTYHAEEGNEEAYFVYLHTAFARPFGRQQRSS